jgi:hypothetical protein
VKLVRVHPCRFWVSLPPLDYLIIPHSVGFVKNFFYFLFLDSVRSTWKQSLAFLRIGIRVAFYISLFLYLTALLYHRLFNLSRGFFLFQKFFLLSRQLHPTGGFLFLGASPLDNCIIPQTLRFDKMECCTKKELLFEFSLCILPAARAKLARFNPR